MMKHATAKRVTVVLFQTSDVEAELLIRDDGQGFDVDTRQLGFGILTMQDYCGAVGGILAVKSTPGSCTAVRALFPLSGSGADEVVADPVEPAT